MKKYLFLILFVLFAVSCVSTNDTHEPISGPIFTKPGKYNLKITVFNSSIRNPDNDRRSYYRVYIDKISSGRTEIGLESQKKTFTAMLSENRHLVRVEKFVLSESDGKYIKLNNIYQPKPSYAYFDIVEDRITVITINQDDVSNKAKIDIVYAEE